MASMAGDRLPWDDEVDGTIEIDLASARLARELRDSARQVIGLLPASETVPIHLVAKQVAIAYSRLTRTTVVIADPEARSVAADPAAPTGRESISSEVGHALFSTRRVDPLILLCAPDQPAPPGAKAELLKLMLRHVDQSASYGMILVDLVGFVWPGELASTLSRLDGVIVVGHSGRTKEPELVRAARLVPPDLALGVLLAESQPAAPTSGRT